MHVINNVTLNINGLTAQTKVGLSEFTWRHVLRNYLITDVRDCTR